MADVWVNLFDAANHSYDNTESGLTATKTKDAIDELAAKRVEVVSAPSASTSTGRVGQVAWDSTYFYFCVATDTWVRATFSGTW